MSQQWKPTSRLTRFVSAFAAVLIASTLVGTVAVGLTTTSDELAATWSAPA